jgi:hypothetical protein
MSWEYRDDSDVPRPTGEGTCDPEVTEAAHGPSPGSPVSEAFDAGSLTTEHAKDALGRRPTLGALIGWYAGLLQGSRSRRQGIDRHLVGLAGRPVARKVANTLTTAVLV